LLTRGIGKGRKYTVETIIGFALFAGWTWAMVRFGRHAEREEALLRGESYLDSEMAREITRWKERMIKSGKVRFATFSIRGVRVTARLTRVPRLP
jgi:hypothetical protein